MKKILIGMLTLLIPVALLIGMLTLLNPVATNAPAPAAEIKIDPSNNPDPTPDLQMQQGETFPKEFFTVPEYPIVGGVVALLACFAALAVYKGAKLHKQKP